MDDSSKENQYYSASLLNLLGYIMARTLTLLILGLMLLGQRPVFAQAVVTFGDDFIVLPVQRTANPDGPTLPTISRGFDYVRANEQILTGFPIGHNLPEARNELFYNLLLDGYGGLPFGSCLRRGYLIPANDPNKEICTANENEDLMRVWANRNPNLKNVLLKNMTIKNAFRTYNVVDGEVVKNSQSLPHTDTFQSFYLGTSQENPDWLVIQDTVIKNSDNSLMIHGGGRFAGAVYQNLHTGCDAEFKQDDADRTKNDYAEFRPGDTPPASYSCTNSVTFSSRKAAPVWLIGVQTGGAVSITNSNAPVIVIGDAEQSIRVFTRDSNRKSVPHPNVTRYNTIESALEEHAEPPYLKLSCTGWQSLPRGCESRLGYIGS